MPAVHRVHAVSGEARGEDDHPGPKRAVAIAPGQVVEPAPRHEGAVRQFEAVLLAVAAEVDVPGLARSRQVQRELKVGRSTTDR